MPLHPCGGLAMDLPNAAHRPWPLPPRPWVLAMQWHDLLFMHGPVPPALLRPLIPPALELETFDGTAWLGITPFRMAGTRPRFVPPLPWVSAFPELNVRTYVTAEGKPGVWFFSLDAGNPLAARGAGRRLRRALPPERPSRARGRRLTRVLADRALLPLRRRPSGPGLARQH